MLIVTLLSVAFPRHNEEVIFIAVHNNRLIEVRVYNKNVFRMIFLPELYGTLLVILIIEPIINCEQNESRI